jgi:hypothetical protein
MVATPGGINAAPESFFPTLPSLSTLMEDAAEGFSNLFVRSTDRRSSDEEAPAGVPLTVCAAHEPECAHSLSELPFIAIHEHVMSISGGCSSSCRKLGACCVQVAWQRYAVQPYISEKLCSSKELMCAMQGTHHKHSL